MLKENPYQKNVGGENTKRYGKVKSAKESVDNFLKGGKNVCKMSGRMTANVFSINFESLN